MKSIYLKLQANQGQGQFFEIPPVDLKGSFTFNYKS